MTYVIIYGGELCHHGIKGQKWGVRRFQNADGSLKAAGRERYTEDGSGGKKPRLTIKRSVARAKAADEKREAKNARAEQKREARRARAKKAVKIGATVAASALLAYGTYKLLDKAEVANTGRKLSKKALAENNGDFEASYKAILGREQKAVHEYAVGNLDKSAMDRAKRVYSSSSKQLASQWIHSKRQNSESMRELSELAGKRTIGRIYR